MFPIKIWSRCAPTPHAVSAAAAAPVSALHAKAEKTSLSRSFCIPKTAKDSKTPLPAAATASHAVPPKNVEKTAETSAYSKTWRKSGIGRGRIAAIAAETCSAGSGVLQSLRESALTRATQPRSVPRCRTRRVIVKKRPVSVLTVSTMLDGIEKIWISEKPYARHSRVTVSSTRIASAPLESSNSPIRRIQASISSSGMALYSSRISTTTCSMAVWRCI